MTAESRNFKQQPAADSKLDQWLSRKKTKTQDQSLIKKLPDNQLAPLSYGQLRLWFLQQLNPGNPFYHYAERCTIQGELDNIHLLDCFEKIVDRHDILRTTFHESNGSPWQQVNPTLAPERIELDLSGLNRSEKHRRIDGITLEQATRSFDLVNGPLIRIGLFSIDEQCHELVLIMHHIIADQGSMEIIREEWADLYRGKDNDPPTGYRYVDFAFDQRQQTVNKVNQEYWLQKLAGDLPRLEFPTTQKKKPGNDPYQGAYHQWSIPTQTVAGLKELSKQSEATMFVLLLSVFKVLLYRYTGESDILVATPVSNRNQLYLEKMIGFFNETMVLRDQLTGSMSFSRLIKEVQSTVLDAFSHQDIPFESVVKELKPDRLASSNPLFQVMFLYHKTQDTPSLGPDLKWEHRSVDIGVSKFDLTLHFHEDHDQLTAFFEYSHNLFDLEIIENMQAHLTQLISGMLNDPTQSISKPPMVTAEERNTLLHLWNHPITAQHQYHSVTELLEEIIEKYPQQTAIVTQNISMTYAELGLLSDHYASILSQNEVGYGQRVGICTEKSPEMIIGLLAALKCGAAYVPMDAAYPDSRLQYMTEDAAVTVILTQEHLLDQVSAFHQATIPINVQPKQLHRSKQQPRVKTQASSCAYVMYTSGSTGKPKGVSISHDNLLSSTLARISYYQDPPDSFLLMSSHGFDSSIAGIFWTLGTGGSLMLPPHRIEQDMGELSTLIEEHRVTHTLMLHSLYNALLQHGIIKKLNVLNTVIVAGESGTPKTIKYHFEHLPKVKLYNEYGPTEATVWSTVHRFVENDIEKAVPIGKPISNSRVYLLDVNLNLVPAGVIGEIYVCGEGISSGYLNLPELTNLRFIPSPFQEDQGAKMYKTGDLGRYLKDGSIEFIGRADEQIKLRGFRVEPDEINSALMKFQGVKESAVALKYPTKTIKTEEMAGVDELVGLLEGLNPSEAETILKAVELIEQFNFNE